MAINPEQRWSYVEPAGPDRNPEHPDEPVMVTMTEQEILDSYYGWWSEQVRKRGRGTTAITEENCIADWVTVHWASKVP